jgi:hypothetical protein
LFGNFALEVGDSHRALADAISLFFREWHQWLCGLLNEAKNGGMLRPDADCNSLGRLVMSTMEGAILIYKASKDKDAFLETIQGLKSAIQQYRT